MFRSFCPFLPQLTRNISIMNVPRKPLFLNADEVEKNLSLDKLIDGIEKGFVDFSTKKAGVVQPERMVIDMTEGNSFVIKPAISQPCNTIATKLVTRYPDNESKFGLPSLQSVIVVLNSKTGEIEGVLDGTVITDVRTAAATAVAVRHLSKQSDNILGIIGTGHQAASHVKVLRHCRNFKEIRVFGRNKERREKFAKTWGVIPCATAAEAVNSADVIVTATMSKVPVIQQEWIKSGALINVIGASFPDTREVGDRIMLNSQVLTDTIELAYKKAGDILATKVKIDGELGDVINGSVEIKWDKTRVFKSNGMALQDLVAGRIVIDNYLSKIDTKEQQMD